VAAFNEAKNYSKREKSDKNSSKDNRYNRMDSAPHKLSQKVTERDR